MRYMGSKARLAKHILPVLEPYRKEFWVEPFVGGGNMIDKVACARIGADTNKYVVALLCALRDGWLPPDTLSREEYEDIKNNKDDYPEHLVGFAGTSMSFGGKFFGGYAFYQKGTFVRDICGEQRRYCLKQAPLLKGAEFKVCSYKDLEIPDSSLIYCDPPYRGTTKYGEGFNHDDFWRWAERQNNIFVSEYSAPEGWKPIWQKEVSSTLDTTKSKRNVEKVWCKI